MNYIVYDLEFNQDIPSFNNTIEITTKYPYEIIQIGAIKLDENYNTVDTFNRYVKPTIYSQISTFITELTGITTDQLLEEDTFPSIYHEFIEFIGGNDSVLCIWGMSDIKELFRNVEYYNQDKKLLPVMYINIQPYTSMHFNLPKQKLLKLQTAVEMLHIEMPYPFHNALHDAYYTAELYKKINHSSIQTLKYDLTNTRVRPKQYKRAVDFDMLLQQFEKMYARELSKEEQEMIKLAYNMGKTHQFLK